MTTKTRASGQRAGARAGRTGVPAEGSGAAPAATEEQGAGKQPSVRIHVPLVTAELRAPSVHVPSRQEVGETVRQARSMLPSRSVLLFCGGLAATAALGVIDWPVAIAVGAGLAIARGAGDGASKRDEQAEAASAASSSGRES